MNIYDWVYHSLDKTAAYRPRVETLVTDSKGHILVGHDRRNIFSDAPVFPGGGVDPKDARKLGRAAQREVLEEAGMDVGGIKQIKMKPHVTPWGQSKQDHFQYRKGLRYKGEQTHFFRGKAGKQNLSEYGADRDQLRNLRFLPRDQVRKMLHTSIREAYDDQERNEYEGRLRALQALR